jgi:hypothetical protein
MKLLSAFGIALVLMLSGCGGGGGSAATDEVQGLPTAKAVQAVSAN